MGNDFYNPTGYENEGLPSGRNLEGQSTLGHPVISEKYFNFVRPVSSARISLNL